MTATPLLHICRKANASFTKPPQPPIASKDEVVYVGDGYGQGGNDESVLLAGFGFVKIDDYTTLSEKLEFLI